MITSAEDARKISSENGGSSFIDEILVEIEKAAKAGSTGFFLNPDDYGYRFFRDQIEVELRMRGFHTDRVALPVPGDGWVFDYGLQISW